MHITRRGQTGATSPHVTTTDATDKLGAALPHCPHELGVETEQDILVAAGGDREDISVV